MPDDTPASPSPDPPETQVAEPAEPTAAEPASGLTVKYSREAEKQRKDKGFLVSGLGLKGMDEARALSPETWGLLRQVIEEGKAPAPDSQRDELHRREAIWRAVAEAQVLDPALAFKLLDEDCIVEDGKVLLRDEDGSTEELTGKLATEVLPADVLISRGYAGSGGKSPRSGPMPDRSDPIERATLSQGFYKRHKAEVREALERQQRGERP